MHSETQILAWHGWLLRIPSTWNPAKLEGDYDQGSMLLADLGAARLGIRWRSAKRGAGRDDAKKWADRALRDELSDSADHARAFAGKTSNTWTITRLHLATDFPARDVFVGWSTRSKRVIELVYNVSERDGVLERDILPTLDDTSPEASHRWSVFGLDVTTPPEHSLQSFALNAGDLSLTFRSGRTQTTIRRISPASLALARQPLERWLTLSKSNRKIYRSPSKFLSLPLRGRLGGGGERLVAIERTTTLPAPTQPPPEGEEQVGETENRMLIAIAKRRRRLCWAWFLPRELHLLAVHDEAENRLLLGTSSDRSLLHQLMWQLTAAQSDVSTVTNKRELAGVA